MTFVRAELIGLLLVAPFAALLVLTVDRALRRAYCQRHGHDWQPDEGGWCCPCCRRWLPDV